MALLCISLCFCCLAGTPIPSKIQWKALLFSSFLCPLPGTSWHLVRPKDCYSRIPLFTHCPSNWRVLGISKVKLFVVPYTISKYIYLYHYPLRGFQFWFFHFLLIMKYSAQKNFFYFQVCKIVIHYSVLTILSVLQSASYNIDYITCAFLSMTYITESLYPLHIRT